MLHRWLHINTNDPVERNAYYLIVEVFWAAILGAIATFNGVYAVRLGASNTDIGLLNSIPALLAIIVSIPAGKFLQSRPLRKPWILWSLGLHRTGYLLVALVPLLKIFNLPVGEIAVWLLILNTSLASFFNTGWIPMLAEVVPEERRSAVFAARNMVNGLTASLVVFFGGLFLNNVIFPVNYQILYTFGFAASMLSQLVLVKINAPEVPAPPAPPKIRRTLRQQAGDLRRYFGEQPGFTRIVVNTFLHGSGVWMAAPVYILFFVRTLGADEAWVGLNGTVNGLATIVGFMFWRWGMKRLGEPLTLKLTIVCAGLYPLLVGVLGNLGWILLATAFNALVVAGINLSHFTTLLKVIPKVRRPEYFAVSATLVNIGAFIMPLVGVALGEIVGFGPVLILCGVLTIAGSTSFWWWPVVFESGSRAKLLDGAGHE